MSETRRVPTIGRILDAAAALLFAAGVALYTRSWLGLRDIEAYVPAEGTERFSMIEIADSLARTGRIGIVLMAIAIAVGIGAALVARYVSRRRARAP